ncbi:transposon Ty3-G Gag-Pol polyprotein [Nephila pilipes]|uniref:Transposon Ty3-G Gag-Pol polyprotein n=1 Tax=Nephila pilipes TaxID=299642 RepID=A0A8X6MZZ8_NEPPI|nr:transposon Ty3-G Gag-Pol polyprotein [Nephila pilipes]
MRKDCKAYVRSCHKCQIVNRRTANAYGLLQQLPIPSTPWEIVSADHIVCLPQTRNGNTNMLVQIDHATRYVIATPSASLAAHTVTDALYHNIILRYGPPSMYLSDRGTAFTARHTRRFLQKYGITQSTTPPYSPQANSIVERANGIIVSTLKKMIDQNPNKWDELLPNASLAINTTEQNSIKKSPFYLLHGAEAANNVYETHLENKKRFDLHRRSHSFTAGDLVLYDWPKKGDHKLSPIFKGPFVIVRPVGAVCYEFKSTTQQNKFIKVVHARTTSSSLFKTRIANHRGR